MDDLNVCGNSEEQAQDTDNLKGGIGEDREVTEVVGAHECQGHSDGPLSCQWVDARASTNGDARGK
jgi:hypothetical protein